MEGRGIAATGIDVSPGAVVVSRDRGCSDVREGDVLVADDSVLPQAAFQTVILFGNNVGIGGTIEGAAKLLERLMLATKPAGRLLVTGLDIADTSSPHPLIYHARNRDRGRPIGEIRMRFEYEGSVGDWLPWFHPEPTELNQLAKGARWALDRCIPVNGPFYGAVFEKPL